jgi:hypothetical protein
MIWFITGAIILGSVIAAEILRPRGGVSPGPGPYDDWEERRRWCEGDDL